MKTLEELIKLYPDNNGLKLLLSRERALGKQKNDEAQKPQNMPATSETSDSLIGKTEP